MSASARPGQIACLCPDIDVPDIADPRVSASVLPLAGGFAAAVLSQVLGISALPLAGALVAPEPGRAAWPLAALLVGAVVSTLPTVVLRDAFGRRAAFALGASLGLAGGLLCAWAVIAHQFAGLVVGAFWLGIAQGFGLFYRHEAAALAPWGRARTIGAVFAAGALAGLLAPGAARYAEELASPYPYAGTLAAAALAHVIALACAFRLPVRRGVTFEAGLAPAARVRDLIVPTLTAGLAWFAMARLMALSPLAMAACGVSFDGIAGLVAWHVVAMYAPALFLAPMLRWLSARQIGWIGLAICAAGSATVLALGQPLVLAAGLAAVGVGWCFASVGATLALDEVRPSSLQLAAHDAVLLVAALLGAVLLPPV